MTRTRCLVSWSSGKDSAWTVHVLRRKAKVEVVGLFTVTSRDSGRVPLYGADSAVLEAQADAIGLPLELIEIPSPCSDAEYAATMERVVDRAIRDDIGAMAFGDVFLEDVRAYREERLRRTDIAPVFPLWGTRSDRLVRTILREGIQATIAAVDTRKLPEDLVGLQLTEDLIDALPAGIDPCGENGEFHTVVTDGPVFSTGIVITLGRVIHDDGLATAKVRLAS